MASLREERERLQSELARVEQAITSLEGTAAPPAPPPYTALNLYEATAHFLAKAGEPKTTSEIAAAIRAGGLRTRSRYLTQIVATMLRRDAARYYGIHKARDGKRWEVKPR